MIALDYQYGFVIYVFIWLFTITILWGREIWRLKTHDWTLAKETLALCDGCHLSFVTKHSENILRCPRCNEMVIVRKKNRF